VNLWNDGGGAGLFAYARRLDTEEVFVVFNTYSASNTLPARSTIYAPGTTLVNLLETNETIVITAATNTPSIGVGPSVAKMFIAQSLLKPLDPVVISQSPAHAATNVPTTSPIVLLFSKPMETNSVQSAFSIQPSAAGTFSWNAARDAMTFTPSGPGLAASAKNVIRLDSGTDSVSSNSMYGPFESFLDTAPEADTDGDGLPDWWEQQHFGSPTAAVPGAQNDGDGVNNLDEYWAGTDPTNSVSYPRIEDLDYTGNTTIQFYTVTGRTYSLEFNTNPLPITTWASLQSGYPGTNGWVTFNDTNQSDFRAYRLRINKL
jgi:hypothetical protein